MKWPRDVLTVLSLAGPVLTQQLSNDNNATSTQQYPGLSTACQNALNSTVSCPGFLLTTSATGEILDSEHVNALCTSSCYSSLVSTRAVISKACTASTDTIVYNDIAYPATFIADQYLFSYNVSCTKNGTGAFCDPQLYNWSTTTFIDPTDQCSECWLGVQALQLNSPLGYDDSLASNFALLTSSCNATGYAWTSPTAYALNSSATAPSPTSTATTPDFCTGSYTVQPTDDCNIVAKTLNVSTYSLLYSNNLDIYCQNFSLATTVCAPPQCATYTWQASDSCDGVVGNLTGVTITQFLSWNPNFNSLCQNTVSFTGYEVCISPPGGLLNSTTPGNLATTVGPASTAAPAPTNAMQGSNRDCGNWYNVSQGDTCAQVSIKNSISLSDFYFLNPEINANCTNLDLGVAYCVEAVGNIATYSGYQSTQGSITVTPATFSSVNTAIPTTTYVPYTYTISLLPTASGTISGCYMYDNYDSDTTAANNCSVVAYGFGVTTAQLSAWNPSLSNDSSCALQPGYSYCVMQYKDSTSPVTSSTCISINTTDIVSGTAANCDCFTEITGYLNGSYTCVDIESDNSISASDLTTWNPWLRGNCDTALYANLGEQASRAVCVGVNASAPVGTASSATTTMSQTGSGTTSASQGPTPTGIVAGCQEFYTVQSGDSCSSIEQAYSITFAQFYAWNPSIGSSCTNLWLGYAYCVQGPASSSTTAVATTTTAGTSSPTQSGIASNCDEYYTVASGDSCSKIETQFNITFAELYQWNPAIGSNCQSLLVGYAVCVGVNS